MAKASKWFKEVFLPSFDSKMNHPKYPNRCILSEKQANVCHRNMTEKPCHGDYNEWYNVYEAETETAKYTMYTAGRYTFLTKTEKAETTIGYLETGYGFDVIQDGEKVAEIRTTENGFEMWEDGSSDEMELWDTYKTLEDVKKECVRWFA